MPINCCCDIIIPVYNHATDTITCLESLLKHTCRRHPIWVIDDRSNEDELASVQSFAENHPGINILRRPENGGFGAAVNTGIFNTSCEYICLLNNDTEVTEGWLESLLSHLERFPEIGAVNPASNQFKMSYDPLRPADSARRIFVHRASGFCMVFKREVIDKIGGFDLAYGRGYVEDADFCRRMRETLGLKSAIVLDAFVFHNESRTFGKKSKERQSLMKRNRRIYLERWGISKRFLFVVPKNHAAAFKDQYQWSFDIADRFNHIDIITNSKSLSEEINDPLLTSLPHHTAVKSIHMNLPTLPLLIYAWLKFTTAKKPYTKFLAFTGHFNAALLNAIFIPKNRYKEVLAGLAGASIR